MAAYTRKRYRRRISWLPTFFSISLVLFLAGLLGMVLVDANILKEKIKENVQLSVYFKDEATEADINRVQKQLDNESYVLETKFISKEEGLKKWQEEMGDSAVELLGFNPIPNSVDVKFKAGFVNTDSLYLLKKELENNITVREVNFNEDVVENIDRNLRLISLILFSLALLMGLVSIALIYNTIRLTLYSKRFIIKSMQLVGATQGFIRRPFITRGVAIGFGSGLFACLLLSIVLYLMVRRFPYLETIQDYQLTGILFFGITLLGIVISGMSSYFAVSKYLKMKLDDLF